MYVLKTLRLAEVVVLHLIKNKDLAVCGIML
jgi:hypothetical protein